MLDAEPDNERRSALLLKLLMSDVDLGNWDPSDMAAITRVLELADQPGKLLPRLALYIEDAMVRHRGRGEPP